MRMIIIGGGRMGATLAKDLAEGKHDVVIIEKDPKICEELSSDLNATIIEGEATEPKILEEAGIEKADVLVATINEGSNLLACLVAKKLNKECKTVARISHKEYEEIFKKSGVDIVVYPEDAVASYLDELVTNPGIIDLAFIREKDVTILEFAVNEESDLIGKEVKEIKCPKGSLIISISKGKDFVVPNGKSILKKGDKILVITKTEIIDDVRKVFK